LQDTTCWMKNDVVSNVENDPLYNLYTNTERIGLTLTDPPPPPPPYTMQSNRAASNEYTIGAPRNFGTAIGTPETCKGICDALGSCKGFQMNKSNTMCWMKNDVVSNVRETSWYNLYTNTARIDLTLTDPATTTPATTTPATTDHYTKESDQTKNGGYIPGNSGTFYGNLAQCKVFCDSLDACGGFTINKSQTQCYVKTNIDDLAPDGEYDTYGKPGGGVPSNGTYTSRYNYTKYTDQVKMGGGNGGVISGYEDRETNLIGCKALCESLDDCIGFVTDKSQTNCWVKNSLSNLQNDTGFDTYRKGFERTLIQF
jgi:hypothetical protein